MKSLGRGTSVPNLTFSIFIQRQSVIPAEKSQVMFFLEVMGEI